MARLLGVFTLALAVPAALLAADPPAEGKAKPKGKGQALIGQYEITGGEKDGTPIPAERLKGSTVTITEDTIAVIDGEKKELYSAKYTLVKMPEEKGAWEIDMESKVPKEGAKALGLIKRDAKGVVLIYALGDSRPEAFDKTEKGQHLFKLTRTAKPADSKG